MRIALCILYGVKQKQEKHDCLMPIEVDVKIA